MTKRKNKNLTGNGGETHQTAGDDLEVMTTQVGMPISDDQNTLKIATRGPHLLEDQVFREKLFHFDHERIPERVVHARGYGAHGTFELTESLSDLSRADIFQRVGEKTDVFVRFSVSGVAAPHCRRDQALRVDTHPKRRSAFRNVRKEFVPHGAGC